MDFTKDELVDMTFTLGEAQRNPLLACRIYKMHYADRRQPSRRAFENLLERFCSIGSVSYSKPIVNKRVCNEEKEYEILLHIQENPHLSSREIASVTNISQSSVNRVTNKFKYHPFHIELHQELHENDFRVRELYCHEMLGKIAVDYNFLGKILFSDEASFKSNGIMNRHNMHYYATENPKWMRQVNFQNRWTLNVWCGIIDNKIIGPYFFDQPLTGVRYLTFLQETLPQLLEDVNLQTRQRMWFQQDGAPPHYHHGVREFLNTTYAHKWLGREGVIRWPPRSCDLTPLDFFLWGYIKNKVYMELPTTIEDMKNRIRNVCNEITPETLHRVKIDIVRRLNLCIQVNGNIFEHLL